MKRVNGQKLLLVLVILLVGTCVVIRQLPGNRLKRLVKKGNELLQDQEYEKAVQVFDRALRIDSKNATAYFARGDAYAGLGETQKARLDYIRAEELNARMAGAVEQKLSEMNAVDRGDDPMDDSSVSEDLPQSEIAASENGDSNTGPPEQANETPGVALNREAMNAVRESGDPSEYPEHEEMISSVVDLYNAFHESSDAYRQEVRGPLTIFYSNEDGHIGRISAPAGTYADHDNEFEKTLNADYYYRANEDGSLEPMFIYLSDDARTEEHYIYLWGGRIIRYIGPVDSADYQRDFSPAISIEEFCGQVPQGVFAANAFLEILWLS